ncbi:MAG: bifunctional helix-turn-helix transcriptional regulator/GNAT family N-acetyltransferase [Bacteroidetes bacterium]|nr:bifunctional helix-turn-helix transcriptional regulator/GNAT family N-acetyltransferase [Bacteroidota bacterium]
MSKTGTDLIKHLGELAFATRLKRLAESLQADVGRIYREMNVDFEPKWFTMLYALYHNETMSVIELSNLLRLTHPAIIQFAEQMQEKKLVTFIKDKNDARKKLIQLTAKGKNIFEGIEPILHEIEIANREFLRESGADVLGVIEKMEKQLELKSMYKRVNERLAKNFRKEIEIVSYSPKLKNDFKRLNVEWLKKYFTVEPIDERVLSNPKKEIIDKDGEIFFALYKDEVIGTVAVKKSSPKTFEILKMAVTEKFQSKGIGRLLMNRAVDYAKCKKAKSLELDTSRKLEGAMKLYESFGFRISDEQGSESYERCTVKMSMDLNALFFLLLLSSFLLMWYGAMFGAHTAPAQNVFTDILFKAIEHIVKPMSFKTAF